MGEHNEFGKKGEDLAVDHLVGQGYTIVERNYRHDRAEVDIIARKDGILAIVEVKSRSSEYWQNISEIITEKKIRFLVKVANQYVLSHDMEVEVRFDIITVLREKGGFKIEHLENAFYHF